MSGVPLLVCRDLQKSYGDRVAVGGLSFDVLPGQAYGLLGPNGAGKTTTIKMICGLLPPDAGEVLIGGVPMNRKAIATRRRLGYVPHEIALYPNLTARENLEFWGRMNDFDGHRLAEKVDSVLDIVDLHDRAKDRVKTFSSGMQRRLNLGVALLGEPRLLVLDEPTVGVDPQSRGAILERLDVLRSTGVAILYSSHHIGEVEHFCDVVGIIDHGKFIAEGHPDALVRSLGGRQNLTLEASGNVGSFVGSALTIPEVEESKLVDGAIRLLVTDAAAAIPRIMALSEQVGAQVEGIKIGTANLEEVFLQLTGRTMRDE